MVEGYCNVNRDKLHHICQISGDQGVIFYIVWDYIVFFCILCTNVRKYKVVLVAVTLMANHIHVAFFGNLSEIEDCMRSTLSSFCLEYNKRGGTCRLKFRKGLNKSVKVSAKKSRNCLIYILNNPVEKYACGKALEYRWNFLQYFNNNHPFSEEIVWRRSSSIFKRVCSLVTAAKDAGYFIRYDFLATWMKKLSTSERLQLCDFIVSSYNVIDYHSMLTGFGNFEALRIALESTTGSDYDIREDLCKENYLHYIALFNLLRKNIMFGEKGEIRFDVSKALKLANRLLRNSDVTAFEISRYLHLPSLGDLGSA